MSEQVAVPGLTKNEEIVLAALRKAGRPLSAYQIMSKTTGDGVRAPQQVYRALNRLVDYNIVHRIETLNAYFICHHGPHDDEAAFAVCASCGAVDEIPLKSIAVQLRRSADVRGFGMKTAHVELSGLCKRCRG